MKNVLHFISSYLNKLLYKVLNILIFIFFISIVILSLRNFKKKIGYELFVELNNAYGLKKGTNVNFRGVKVGYVSHISIQLNKVVILLRINSANMLIPKKSIIEVNQIGLFNDLVVDITPLIHTETTIEGLNALSPDCLMSTFICSDFYVKGYKGLNYDDLVRATTRISQRFDDPRFFHLFYLLLQNGIDISDEFIIFINSLSCLLTELIPLILYKYIF
uniref:Mce/MlaD domain-containing protein n=1 Tax=Digenea simplex TaxID=945030 RepID=A0A1Z1MU48_DIGSM|nr:hypothetical protein [Digenea simplex]ARW69486.1 hypothetical protein [Digenea simplex]